MYVNTYKKDKIIHIVRIQSLFLGSTFQICLSYWKNNYFVQE
jgi:hypothetical protein